MEITRQEGQEVATRQSEAVAAPADRGAPPAAQHDEVTKRDDVTQHDEVTKRDDVAKQGELRTMAPAVDIFEDAYGITLHAEMPGVSRERLNVQADRNGLSIEGDLSIEMPEGMQALYADVRATRYRRSFTLSGELDTERIEAQLKDGVLTLHIPKRAEFRPRRIEVKAG